MTTPEKEKAPSTYITARFADGTKKDGSGTFKNVVNLFYNGGKDATGNPIVSNHEERIVGWVNKTGAKLDLRKTDKEGNVISDGEDVGKPFLSIGLDRFTKEGMKADALEIGQGAVTGPAAAELVSSFKATIAAKPEKKTTSSPGM